MMWEGWLVVILYSRIPVVGAAAFLTSVFMWPCWAFLFQGMERRTVIATTTAVFCMLQYGIPAYVIVSDVNNIEDFVRLFPSQWYYIVPQAAFYLACQCAYVGYAIVKFVKAGRAL